MKATNVVGKQKTSVVRFISDQSLFKQDRPQNRRKIVFKLDHTIRTLETALETGLKISLRTALNFALRISARISLSFALSFTVKIALRMSLKSQKQLKLHKIVK